MRSDCELLISIFRSEKKMGLVMQTDFAKSDESTHRIIKSKNGIGLQSSKNLAEQSGPGTAAVQQYQVYTKVRVRVAIDALDYE